MGEFWELGFLGKGAFALLANLSWFQDASTEFEESLFKSEAHISTESFHFPVFLHSQLFLGF